MPKPSNNKLSPNELRVIYIPKAAVRELFLETILGDFRDRFHLISNVAHLSWQFDEASGDFLASASESYTDDDLIRAAACTGYTTDSFFRRVIFRTLRRTGNGEYELLSCGSSSVKRLKDTIRFLNAPAAAIAELLEDVLRKNISTYFDARLPCRTFIHWNRERSDLLFAVSGRDIENISPDKLTAQLDYTTESLFWPNRYAVLTQASDGSFSLLRRPTNQNPNSSLRPLDPDRLDNWLSWLGSGANEPFS